MDLNLRDLIASFMKERGIVKLVLTEAGTLHPEYGTIVQATEMEDPLGYPEPANPWDDPDMFPEGKKPEFSK